MATCDCTHDAPLHDPVSGACLVVNRILGPCPCAATPATTRAALEAADAYGRRGGRPFTGEAAPPAPPAPLPETLYSDTYQGPRWVYGLRHRPLNASTVPPGWIVWSDRDHAAFAHGTVDYPRQLTVDEVAGFELVPLGVREAAA